MSMEQWWPRLRPSTQEWLMENNGDVVPAQVVAEIAEAGGPGAADSWWAGRSGIDGRYFPDEAVDWIEAIANQETPQP